MKATSIISSRFRLGGTHPRRRPRVAPGLRLSLDGVMRSALSGEACADARMVKLARQRRQSGILHDPPQRANVSCRASRVPTSASRLGAQDRRREAHYDLFDTESRKLKRCRRGAARSSACLRQSGTVLPLKRNTMTSLTDRSVHFCSPIGASIGPVRGRHASMARPLAAAGVTKFF